MTKPKNTNAALVEAYERDARVQGLSDLTLKSYRHGVDVFVAHLGPKHASKATVKDLAAFLSSQKELKLDPRTLSGRISALSSFFEFLEYDGQIVGNPVPGFR